MEKNEKKTEKKDEKMNAKMKKKNKKMNFCFCFLNFCLTKMLKKEEKREPIFCCAKHPTLDQKPNTDFLIPSCCVHQPVLLRCI